MLQVQPGLGKILNMKVADWVFWLQSGLGRWVRRGSDNSPAMSPRMGAAAKEKGVHFCMSQVIHQLPFYICVGSFLTFDW